MPTEAAHHVVEHAAPARAGQRQVRDHDVHAFLRDALQHARRVDLYLGLHAAHREPGGHALALGRIGIDDQRVRPAHERLDASLATQRFLDEQREQT